MSQRDVELDGGAANKVDELDKSAMLSDMSGLYPSKSPFVMKFNMLHGDDVSNNGGRESLPEPRKSRDSEREPSGSLTPKPEVRQGRKLETKDLLPQE